MTLDAESRVGGAAPVVDMAQSPHARLRPVSIASVRLQDDFWAPRIAVNSAVTLPSQLKLCEDTGRIDNFRRASGKKQIPFQGVFFNDSDLYKWAEAASFALAANRDPALEAQLDDIIAEIEAAQQPDGYLSTFYTFERAGERWSDLKDHHEIYCAGHLLQAAVAHHRATGKTTLLQVAIRLADCLDRTFGPDGDKRPGACGHPEAEMALVELFRETGDRRYLHLAVFMIECRGREPGLFGNSPYYQDHLPFRDQTRITGHAVRHLYLASGATDVVAEADPQGYWAALEALWNSFTSRRMYVTGGAGARHEGEAFGEDYELPNDRAYAETCAAIASVMWNWRMLNLTGACRFADLIERTLYNAVMPGLSLEGTHYFYVNPLADDGRHRRQTWFGTACCPPNVARLLASLSGYFYSVSDEGVWAHLYAQGTADLRLPNGEAVSLVQETRYPWDGEIAIRIVRAPIQPFSLFLRVPAWAREAQWRLEGQPSNDATPGGFVEIRRTWQAGDVIRLTLPMPVEKIVSHPHLAGNAGRVAFQRGPLLYCLEQTDHPDVDIRDIVISHDTDLVARFEPEMLGGVVVLRGQANALAPASDGSALYRPLPATSSSRQRPAHVTAIPYYAWANRQPGAMEVWIRKE